MPAGPIAVAAGLSSRWEAGAYLPDPMTASGNTTGSKAIPTDGAYSVKALYAEAQLPLYKAGDVGLGAIAAGRTFHYDTFGSGFTHELGTRLELPQGLACAPIAVRATRVLTDSTASRPTLLCSPGSGKGHHAPPDWCISRAFRDRRVARQSHFEQLPGFAVQLRDPNIQADFTLSQLRRSWAAAPISIRKRPPC